MFLQFTVVEDNSIWIVDTQFLQWGRVSAPQSDPTSVVLESGKLVPQGFGIYALAPRKTGLVTIGTYLVGIGQTIKIYLRANIPIKDFTMPVPIRQVLYEILPADPKQVEQSIQEMTDDSQGQQAAEPPGPQEPEVSRELSETASRTEQTEAETSVELGDGQVG